MAYTQYAYRSSAYPDFAPSRTEVRVVPGSRRHPQEQNNSIALIARIVLIVMAVLTAVCITRIWLSSAAVTTLVEGENISSSITEARAEGTELEVQQTSLASTSTLKGQAERLNMSAATDIQTIVLDEDVAVIDSDGTISLAQSVEAATRS